MARNIQKKTIGVKYGVCDAEDSKERESGVGTERKYPHIVLFRKLG